MIPILRFREHSAFLYVVLGLLVFGVFVPCLTYGYVWDDTHILPGLRRAWETGTWFQIFWKPFWEVFGRPGIGYFRPISMLFLTPDALFFSQPWLSHLTNLLLHTLNVLLAFHVGVKLMHSRAVGWVAALVWGVHPVVSESVCFVSARENLLVATFLFLALIFWVRFLERRNRFHLIFSLGFMFLMIGTKEVALPLVLMAPLVMYLKSSEQEPIKGRYVLPFLLLMIAYFLFYLWVAGFSNSGQVAWVPELNQILGFGWLAVQHVFFPISLAAAYPPANLIFQNSIWICGVVLFCGVVFGSVWLFSLLKRHIGSAPLSLVVLPLIPTFILSAQLRSFADRYLYVSAFGVTLLLSMVLTRRVRRFFGSGGGVFVLLGMVLFLSVLTQGQVRIWADETKLFGNMLQSDPDSGVARLGKAAIEAREGHLVKAEKHMRVALKSPAHKAAASIMLAKLFAQQGEEHKALNWLRKADQLQADRKAYCETASKIAIQFGRKSLFESAMKELKKHDPNSPVFLWIRSRVLLQQKKYLEADQTLRKGLSIWPNDLNLLQVFVLSKEEQEQYSLGLLSLQRLHQLSPSPWTSQKLSAFSFKISQRN